LQGVSEGPAADDRERPGLGQSGEPCQKHVRRERERERVEMLVNKNVQQCSRVGFCTFTWKKKKKSGNACYFGLSYIKPKSRSKCFSFWVRVTLSLGHVKAKNKILNVSPSRPRQKRVG